MPIAALAVIAGSDRLFRHTVPLEQRLISHNESIRQKAQQELLGSSLETKTVMAGHLVLALSDVDPFRRKWAAISLALLGPAAQSSIPLLLPRVSDTEKDVAQAVRVALTEIGAPDPAQLPAIVTALQDPREAVSCEAASSLVRLGPPARDAMDDLFALLESTHAVARCLARATTEVLRYVPQAEPRLLQLLDAPTPATRANALKVIREWADKTPTAWESIAAHALREADPALRSRYAVILGLSPSEDETPVSLISLARHSPQVIVRAFAFRRWLSLPEAKASSAAGLYRAVLDDPDPALRRLGLESLSSVPAVANTLAPALLTRLSDTQESNRVLALTLLTRMNYREPSGRTAIATLQKSGDPLLRCAAARQLMEMGASDRIAERRFLNDLGGAEPAALCASEILVMQAESSPAVSRAVVRLVEEGPMDARRHAVALLVRLGAKTPGALAALRKAQKDGVHGASWAYRKLSKKSHKSL